MTDLDVIFVDILDCYIEIRYESYLSSIRFLKSRSKLNEKKTLKATFELEEYFEGKRTGFSRFDMAELSTFEKKVLDETSKIKYGKTIAYSELADKICSRAVRAVGGVLSRNPIPIIIPCHRVVAKKGIGGYSAGVDIKERLLDFEKKLADNL